jgi:hypothetical protein
MFSIYAPMQGMKVADSLFKKTLFWNSKLISGLSLKLQLAEYERRVVEAEHRADEAEDKVT